MLNHNEAERLDTLRKLDLLNTHNTESFDRITRLASRLFDTPVSLITLIDEDRQWFKSRIGTHLTHTSLEDSFCKHAILSDEVMVVPDLSKDTRFDGNSLVHNDPNVRFYAGAPLITSDGYSLGTVCILDTKPRELSTADQETLKDLAAMVMTQIDLQHAVGHMDPLSGLPNRNQLYEDLEDLAQDASGHRYVMMVIDLISMGRVEEILRTLGSRHSDALIRNAARLVTDTVGQSGTLYHIDTARYVCLLPDRGDGHWLSVITSLNESFSEPLLCDGVPVDMHLGIGLSPFGIGQGHGPDIVRTAVTAALDAREAQRDWAMYDPANDQARRRSFNLLADFHKALSAEDQLYLVYQPRIDLASGKFPGAEALIRWKHPELGFISPGEFIPLVEQTALAEPLTEWVINTALAQQMQWQEDGVDICVSVNVSARNLEEKDFVDRLVAALRYHQAGDHAIELEFTESALMRNSSRIIEQLNEVKALGIEIAIDDYGSGYSNHSYLQKLPASIVKIDQSLIRSLTTNPKDQVIVRHMIDMAHELGYRVVAEGVETADILELLRSWGCDEIQGYYIAKPMPADDLMGFLQKSRLEAA